MSGQPQLFEVLVSIACALLMLYTLAMFIYSPIRFSIEEKKRIKQREFNYYNQIDKYLVCHKIQQFVDIINAPRSTTGWTNFLIDYLKIGGHKNSVDIVASIAEVGTMRQLCDVYYRQVCGLDIHFSRHVMLIEIGNHMNCIDWYQDLYTSWKLHHYGIDVELRGVTYI